jgi:hydroxymethylbilane synthase
MQAGKADIAVHSMKDVPAEVPRGFCIAALLERANPADALLSAAGGKLDSLPEAACIGSSSLRRQAQLKACRSDLEIRPLRGNVNTRLQKLLAGEFDAIVLACAGLERLGLQSHISEVFDATRMLPAAAQGVIGIECLEDRNDLLDMLAVLDHQQTRMTTTAERTVAARLQADCLSPVASFASIADETMTLDALVALPDGSRVLRERVSGALHEAEEIGNTVAEKLLQQGAADLLRKTGS